MYNKLYPLENYPDHLVTKNGCVYSLMYNRFLKGWVNKDGRVTYVLTDKNGVTKRKYAHQLVGQTFIPNPLNKRYINHIDGNPFNNKIENLEWCTIAENNRHSREVLKRGITANSGEKHHMSKLNKNTVLQIRSLYKNKKGTLRSLAKQFGVASPTIFSVIHNRTWKTDMLE